MGKMRTIPASAEDPVRRYTATLRQLERRVPRIAFLLENEERDSALALARKSFDDALVAAETIAGLPFSEGTFLRAATINKKNALLRLAEGFASRDETLSSFDGDNARLKRETFATLRSFARLVRSLRRDLAAADDKSKKANLIFVEALVFLKRRIAWIASICGIVVLSIIGATFMGETTGLYGYYFHDRDFSKLYTVRADRQILFNWHWDPPLTGMDKDGFSIRWLGTIRAPVSGVYEFSIGADDGARLWIGDDLIVDAWSPGPWKLASGTVELDAGSHPIRIEYFEDWGSAQIVVYWRHGVMADKVPIPADALQHASSPF